MNAPLKLKPATATTTRGCGLSRRGAHPLSSPALQAALAILLSPLAQGAIPLPVDAPKPMTPEETAASYRLPEGFRLEVVASEPLIASPSGACWTADGTLFVGELHGYNLAGQLDIEELNKSGELDTQVRRVQADARFKKAAEAGTFGVIKRLRDTDGDGRMDQADTWAEGLPPVYGIAPARDGLIAACAPDIVFLADRDGDGKAEVRERLFTGFGTGELERGINAPQWGVDGWIYLGRGWDGGPIVGPRLGAPVTLTGSNFRLKPDGTALEPVTGHSHTFGLAITETGDHITVSTTTSFSVAPLPWRSLVRNPNAAVSGLQKPIGDPRAYGLSKPHPWRQKRAEDPAYFAYYKGRYGASDSEAGGWFTSACGPLVYQDTALPGLHGQYFVCEPAGNLIHRAEIVPDGAAVSLRRVAGEEKSEFAATPDAWSHPMHLLHGPDGAIWVVDYYREIIEDYSAIPRHLQQQYGVYAGHERGRLYRLVHRDMPAPPRSTLSQLSPHSLARECASPLLWRRLTAQRLLAERREVSTAPALRVILDDTQSTSAAVITALRTLEQLDVAAPDEVLPLFQHPSVAVRVHALQVAEPWLRSATAGPVLEAMLALAARETHPRVLIQLVLSLGESGDGRAAGAMATLARSHPGIAGMDAALLSSSEGRENFVLALLLQEPRAPIELLIRFAETIAREDRSIGSGLDSLRLAPASLLVPLLDAMTKARRHAARRPIDPLAAFVLAELAASSSPSVRDAARALEDTFHPAATVESSATGITFTAPADLDEATFRTFTAALAGPRDLARGHQVFLELCAACHRIGQEGRDVGPDLAGELGMAEETLVRHLLAPSERIRPGYEMHLLETHGGTTLTGLIKEEGATSLTLVSAGGAESVILRKDVAKMRRLPISLMPSLAGAAPSDVANVLAWLRESLRTAPDGRVLLFDEEPEFAEALTDQDGTARVTRQIPATGRFCLHVTPPQRASAAIPGWNYHIVENPAGPDEFRFLRLSWRAEGAGAMIELAIDRHWPAATDANGRYFAGRNTTPWQARQTNPEPPREWQTVTLDLWKDMGAFTLTGIAPTAMGGDAWFDRIELFRQPPP